MKRRITTIILVGLLTLVTSCTYRKEGDFKKVVLQKDVYKDLTQEKQPKIVMEEIDLKLEDREHFSPAFYYEGEIYGVIDRGIGLLGDLQPTEKYPIGGQLKQYLYRLQKDNTLKETTKRVFKYNVQRPRDIGYEAYKVKPKLYTINYLEEDEPIEMEDLDRVLKGVDKKATEIREIIIDEDTTYLTIRSHLPFKGSNLYFYDVQKKQLYKRDADILNEDIVVYMQALKSFIRINEDLKVYKAVFLENEYEFVEYMDLSQYINTFTETNADEIVSFQPINDEEVLITKSVPFKKGGYFDHHPIYQTKAISTFNFKTNQFQELFVAKEQPPVYANYVGTVDAAGGDLLIIDEFQENNGYIAPKKRSFKRIAEGQLNTIYQEDIEQEGNTLSPFACTLLSEDGKEIFLEKMITTMENGVETSKGAIYKKYTFE